MVERREEKRTSVYGSIDVVDKDDDKIIGTLVDISPKGLRVKGPESIEVYEYFDLVLRLPERIFGRNEISLVAQCMWSKPDADPDGYASGFRLYKVSQEDINTIIGLILEADKRDGK